MTPLAKDFIRIFDSLGRHRSRYDHFSDFLELAYCAVCKRTLPAGEEADELEARYMQIVGRNAPDDIRRMPELLALTQIAVGNGGCDFLGRIVSQLELLDARSGQFFTPYHISRFMAEATLLPAGDTIAERGFITLQEPACGAGCMVIAAADTLATQGHDIGQVLYIEATDLSQLCFRMAYLQLAARGVPAQVRRANSLSGECFESAYTPAMIPFLERNGDAFMRWREESHVEPIREPRKGEQLVLL